MLTTSTVSDKKKIEKKVSAKELRLVHPTLQKASKEVYLAGFGGCYDEKHSIISKLSE